MGTGLRNLLGLPESNKRDSAEQAVEFKQSFRAGMADVNHDLQAVAGHSSSKEYQAIERQRTQLFEAFQKASAKVDPANPDKAAADIERVLAAVTTLQKKASSLAAGVKAGRDDWLKQQEQFDEALLQVAELEDANHPKAGSLRNVGDAIRDRANSGDYQQAGAALEQFRPKLAQLLGGGPSSGGAAPQLFAQAGVSAAVPNLGQAARDYAEETEGKPPVEQGDSNSAFDFGARGPAVDDDDVRIDGSDPYDKLPEKLKSKLPRDFWQGLEKRQRSTLVDTYRRMKSYGLWDLVVRVVGEKEKPEPHVPVGGYKFEVDGNSGGLIYESRDVNALFKKMIATRVFGADDGKTGAMHPGQTSMREWSNGPTSLHISIGPGNLFDAHIDKVSPVDKPVDGKTQINPERGVKHWEKEVLPEKVRDITKLPIKPKLEAKPKKDGGIEWQVGVEIEMRGPVEEPEKPLVPKSPTLDPAPEKVQQKVVSRVINAVKRFPVSIGTSPGEEPLPDEVAAQLAALMLKAIKNKETRVKIDLPYYRDKTRDHVDVIKIMEKIGRIVHSEFKPDSYVVTSLTVTFGSRKQGETVWISD